jgi:glycosyltransferase involved in cell wall biosynthesis
MAHLVGGRPQASLLELYHTCHLFVLPCIIAANGDRDGLPNVLLEALATGIPVITTAVSGIPELIHDHENGILVPEKDEFKIAAAIHTLVKDPALYQHIAHSGRRLIEERFDINKSTDELYELFREKTEHGTKN